MGYFDNMARAGFVLAPIGVVLIIGMIFLIRGRSHSKSSYFKGYNLVVNIFVIL